MSEPIRTGGSWGSSITCLILSLAIIAGVLVAYCHFYGQYVKQKAVEFIKLAAKLSNENGGKKTNAEPTAENAENADKEPNAGKTDANNIQIIKNLFNYTWGDTPTTKDEEEKKIRDEFKTLPEAEQKWSEVKLEDLENGLALAIGFKTILKRLGWAYKEGYKPAPAAPPPAAGGSLQGGATESEVSFIFLENCVHCVDAKPIFEEIIKENPDLKLNLMDANDNMDFCNTNNIDRVPTIVKKRADGTIEKFDGDVKSKEEILAFARA